MFGGIHFANTNNTRREKRWDESMNVYGITLEIKSEDIRKSVNVASVVYKARKAQLKWFKQIIRMIMKTALFDK